MSRNRNELPTDRLGTSEKSGKRIWLYPADVKGKYRTLRDAFSKILIMIFLALPWLKIRGYQAVLLDIPNRRFSIFGLTFWAHDAPILILVLGGAVLSIALATMIWGRLWCGWACPQTVFVDGVFRKIERWLEGNALDRKNRDEGPWSFEKLRIKGIKWFLFVALGMVISHSFLAYFVGTEKLALMIASSPSENPIEFIIMAGVTLLVVFDFGWFREQFCTLVCPYGRFQSVLMDASSQVVAYDLNRGEPRKGLSSPASTATSSSTDKQGDCINCYRCVQVCPTGIDIRRGVQMECIACTACMDACDEVMTRIDKPKGLIRYATSALSTGEKSQFQKWYTRGNVLGAIALLTAFSLGLSWVVLVKQEVEISLVRAIDSPYQIESTADGSNSRVINHFKIEIHNQGFEDITLQTVSPDEKHSQQGVQVVLSVPRAKIEAGTSRRIEAFIRFSKDLLDFGKSKMGLVFEYSKTNDLKNIQTLTQEVPLVGPLK